MGILNNRLTRALRNKLLHGSNIRLDKLEAQNRFLIKENIGLRLKLKIMAGEPIHVVFVCWRPAVWSSLQSVYEAIKKDSRFRATIVAIPNKKQLPELGLSHEHYESEGAEEFWKGDDVVHGYDYTTGQWLDLQELKPDYVFFQQPYNIARAPLYKTDVVSNYAKICYVSYFGVIETGQIFDDCNPVDFLRDLSFYFTQNQMDTPYLKKRMGELRYDAALIQTGFPRFDGIASHNNAQCDIWLPQERGKRLRIIWTPRWTTNEGNCHFFAYKDKFVEYCKGNPSVDLVFRPHPQAFLEWESTGEFQKPEREAYCKQFAEIENLHLDTSGTYLDMFFSSDCLVTDRSTMFVEYYMTQKPIVYCVSDRNCELDGNLVDGMYQVRSWEELIEVLENLKKGIDPLKEKRKEICDQYFYVPQAGAGETIKEAIFRDAAGRA